MSWCQPTRVSHPNRRHACRMTRRFSRHSKRESLVDPCLLPRAEGRFLFPRICIRPYGTSFLLFVVSCSRAEQYRSLSDSRSFPTTKREACLNPLFYFFFLPRHFHPFFSARRSGATCIRNAIQIGRDFVERDRLGPSQAESLRGVPSLYKVTRN